MNRFLHTIYCDDVREEKSNKITLVGVYSSDLFVAAFPVVLPKLMMFITLVTPAEKPFESLSLKVLRDEETLFEGAIPVDDFRKQSTVVEPPAGVALPSGSVMLGTLRTIATIASLHLTGPCVLRVVASTESGELRCPALRIGLAPLT
jgi:hypothetical protein